MLILYRIFLYLAFPFVMLRLILRVLRDHRYFERVPQRFGFIRSRAETGGIWIHAVSVGEVHAATQLIEHLLEKHPHKSITVTTMTPTGADRVHKTFGERVEHVYLPYDYPGAVKRFLKRIDPCLAVVVETEIWLNLIECCHRLGIPMIYVNVRLSRRSYRGYHRFQKLIAPTLAKINRFAAQTKMDAKRLIHLGALPDTVIVTGSVKFDIELKPSDVVAAKSLRGDWGERPVWIVGSTHEGEEAQILDAFAHIRTRMESLLLVIVPRHPQRFASVFRLCERRGYQTCLRSELSDGQEVDKEIEIYVADTMGELPMLIAASDVAFIGGSLVPVGGHNVLEAAAAGVPVVFGKHMFNFTEIADLLLQHAAGIQVTNSTELTDVVLRLLTDPVMREQYGNNGKTLIEKNRGALKKICAMVDESL